MTWQQVLTEYVRQQRERVAAAYAVGTEEFDGTMDGLRILEWALSRTTADIVLTVHRRQKAERGMLLDGINVWPCGHYRRHHYATTQVLSGGEIVLAAVGGTAVSDRAKLRYAELVAAIQKEGEKA